jgi:16S rRNA (cytosine1402-N4)-methyltransferase
VEEVSEESESAASGSGDQKHLGEGSEDAVGGSERPRDHIPVLLAEVLDVLAPRPGERFLDATVGFGGHAAALLERVGDGGFLVGIDRDEEALEGARRRLARVASSFFLFRGLFSQVRQALQEAGWRPEGVLDGILLDLGVSSYQLDTPRRGFSFLRAGPLDMRMSPGQGRSAGDWLATASVEEMARVFRDFGEEPAARKVARAIEARRKLRPLQTTADLVEAVESVLPAGRRRIHPATRVFQAVRILVNSELEELAAFLDNVDRYLAPGGRLAVISYHSLEDREVKGAIQRRVREGIFRVEGSGVIRPPEEEIRLNPRSRSAKLRWAVRRAW